MMNDPKSGQLQGAYVLVGKTDNFQGVKFLILSHFHQISHCLIFLPAELTFYPLYSVSCPYPHLTPPSLLSSYLPGKIPTWLNPNLCHLHSYSQVDECSWTKPRILTGPYFDLTATHLTGSSLKHAGSHTTFPNPFFPSLQHD